MNKVCQNDIFNMEIKPFAHLQITVLDLILQNLGGTVTPLCQQYLNPALAPV